MPITRRQFLQAGAGIAALPLLANAKVAPDASAKAVIQLWIWGGPSHLDTFDPKPDAGYDYCGPYTKPIATNVDGIRICQALPKLAEQADKYSIIRSMTHGINGHEGASYCVQTGRMPGGRLVYPSVGSVVSLKHGYDAGYNGLIPPYVVLTKPQGRFSEAGFLGSRYKPFATGGDPAQTPFAVEGIVAKGISARRQVERRELLKRLNLFGRSMPGNVHLESYYESKDKAYDLILGDSAKLFDLSQESEELRERYGKNTFGQACLAARRMVEAGVKYVTINSMGWDTHKKHFEEMRRRLPMMDAGFSTLLDDLSDRGLLESTLVWWGGEFGRTPKISWGAPWNGGRGHHGAAFSMVLAGGGFKGGRVVGATDAKGWEVADRPVYPCDLLGSIYERMGIDPEDMLPNANDPVSIVPAKTDGYPSGGRLKELI